MKKIFKISGYGLSVSLVLALITLFIDRNASYYFDIIAVIFVVAGIVAFVAMKIKGEKTPPLNTKINLEFGHYVALIVAVIFLIFILIKLALEK